MKEAVENYFGREINLNYKPIASGSTIPCLQLDLTGKKKVTGASFVCLQNV